MGGSADRPAGRRTAAAVLLIVLTVVVLVARRPDQFLSPYVWIEDGWFLLRMFLERGWAAIAEPVSGYQILANKLVTFTALSLSVLHAPAIMLALVTALTCAVTAAIAFSPTHLRRPFLCALAALLVPTGPEVFSISAYAIWWAGLLLLLTPLWDSQRDHEWLRWSYLVFGGLSSPIILPVTAALWFRAAYERRGREWIAAALASVLSAVQLLSAYFDPPELASSSNSLMTLAAGVQKFAGAYFYAAAPIWFGFVVYAVLGLLIAMRRQRLDVFFVLLLFCFVAIAAMTTLRIFPDQLPVLDKNGDATRYFFYPFVMLSWIMIWLAQESGLPVRIGIAGAMTAAIMLSLPHMSRRNDHLDWQSQINACADAKEYELPILYQGSKADAWKVKFTGAECRALLARSLWR